MSGLVRIGVVLSAGAIVSLVLFLRTNHSRLGPLALWLGIVSLVLVATAVLCLTIAAVRRFESRRQSRSLDDIPTDEDYVAEYSRADRALAIVLTAFSIGLFTIFILRRGHLPAIIISALLVAGTTCALIEVTGTRILFTHIGFVARVYWVRRFTARYADVRRISSKPGTVKVEFVDGRSLNFHTSLGDPDRVIAYLRARCPESVELAFNRF